MALPWPVDKQNFSTGEKKLVNATSSHLDGGVRCIFLMEFVVGFWQLEDLAEMILLLVGFLVFHKKIVEPFATCEAPTPNQPGFHLQARY